MNSFTIRFEGSLSLQDRDENGARSILIQNIRIYLPEEIERGLVPPASTAPCPQPSTSQELPNQQQPLEVQEKQEEKLQSNELIRTPYSIISDDEDEDKDESNLTFQWSWSHSTPPSSSSSSIPPSAPIKSKPNNKIDPFDFSSSSSTSTSSMTNEELFLSYLKQFHMIPENNPSRNPQNKEKDYHHFMFWHHFQHNGYSCENPDNCIKEYLYKVVTSCRLTENEDHDRQRCYTLESIMKKKELQFEPILDYYVTYKNYLSKNENQPWRYNLNRYKLMEKFIKETY